MTHCIFDRIRESYSKLLVMELTKISRFPGAGCQPRAGCVAALFFCHSHHFPCTGMGNCLGLASALAKGTKALVFFRTSEVIWLGPYPIQKVD